jgi:peptide/nickel transport system permease protein
MTILLPSDPTQAATEVTSGLASSPPQSVVDTTISSYRRRTRRNGAAHFVEHWPGIVLALAVVALVLLAALAPRLLTTTDPNATAPSQLLAPPGPQHWFGTDQLGRDLFARVVHGSCLTIEAALLALVIAVTAGLVLGLVSGFFSGAIDTVIMRVVDVLLAIPSLLLALAIVTALGFGIVPVAVAVGIGIAPGFARTTRAEVLRVRSLPYIEAVTVGGASRWRIAVRHVLPNSWGPVATLAVLEFGAAVLHVASLSFLGFGVAPPAAEWGSLISTGRSFVMTAPWLSLIPGAVVVALVFSLNHLARSISDRLT